MRKINSAQAIINLKQEQNKANEKVATDLDAEQTVNATQLSNMLEKMLNEKLKKEKNNRQKTLRQMPKSKHQRPQKMVKVQTTTQHMCGLTTSFNHSCSFCLGASKIANLLEMS